MRYSSSLISRRNMSDTSALRTPSRNRAFEAISVEQPHEQLEVSLLAIVRGRRHQQQVTGPGSEQLARLLALRLLHLAAEVVRRHAVCFIADDEIPLRVSAQLGF